MLKLQFKDRRQEAVWLVDQVFSIGKNSRNSLVAQDQGIEEFHAEIVNQANSLQLKNKSGKENVWINDAVVKVSAKINSGDRIRIGKLELELVDPKESELQTAASPGTQADWAIFSNASWLEKNRYVIQGRSVIGRDNTCDIQLPIEHLSRQHALLEVRNGQLYVKDLGSSNGTYLNGNKVSESPVKNGDKLKFDVVTFDIQGPKFDPNKTIIRTLDDDSSAAQKSSPAKAKSAQGSKPKQKKRPERKLAASGKQEWLKQDSPKAANTKSNGKWVYMSLFATACIIIYFAVY